MTSVTASLSFPTIAPTDLLPFILDARTAADQNAVVERFETWLRQRPALP